MNYYLKEYLALKKHFKCWLLLFSIKSSLNSHLYHGWKIYCYLSVRKSCKLFNNLTKLGRCLWHHMNYWDSETSACIKITGVLDGNTRPEILTRIIQKRTPVAQCCALRKLNSYICNELSKKATVIISSVCAI